MEINVGDVLPNKWFLHSVVILSRVWSFRYNKYMYLVEDTTTHDTMWVAYESFICYKQLDLFQSMGVSYGR